MAAATTTSLSHYKEGDVAECHLSHISSSSDIHSFEGMWEDIKPLCGNDESILKGSGVGWAKRMAMKTATLRTEIKVVGKDENGNPKMFMKSYYPLGITKDSTFLADGGEFTQDDSADTCVWTVTACFVDGRLMQRREGTAGTMYDVRCVMSRHPEGKHDASPIMLFMWTFIDKKGKKSVSQHWLRKL